MHITTTTTMLSGAMLATLGLAATAANASLTTITFENDPVGPTSNSFISVDSPLVTFSNNFDLGMAIGDYGIASDGQGLAVGDNDNSALVMTFSTLMDYLSVDFGNDDPLLSEDGDTAILTLFLGSTQVGQTVVLMNRNTAMDQTLAFSGAQFDSATIDYYVTSSGLTKVVDNVTFNTVPTPGAMGLLTLAGAACGWRRRRR